MQPVKECLHDPPGTSRRTLSVAVQLLHVRLCRLADAPTALPPPPPCGVRGPVPGCRCPTPPAEAAIRCCLKSHSGFPGSLFLGLLFSSSLSEGPECGQLATHRDQGMGAAELTEHQGSTFYGQEWCQGVFLLLELQG